MKDFVGPTLPYFSAFDDSKPTIVPHERVVEVSLKIAKLAHEYPDAFGLAMRDNYWDELTSQVYSDGAPVRGKRPKVTVRHKARLLAGWLNKPPGVNWDKYCVKVAAAGWGPWKSDDNGEVGRSSVAKALQKAIRLFDLDDPFLGTFGKLVHCYQSKNLDWE